jgi:preprotein translocase subunit SecF
MKLDILKNERTRSLFSRLNIYIAITLSALLKACGLKSISSAGKKLISIESTDGESITLDYENNEAAEKRLLAINGGQEINQKKTNQIEQYNKIEDSKVKSSDLQLNYANQEDN